ncbi:hypothetical protein FB451DRAFT_1415908 [Mycena latifolia]|nr:hypothetical protein FB451DRAFT_1415908 [Mycena latifolia]
MSLNIWRIFDITSLMKALILGATGFIGFPAAHALVRAGHIMYGLTRTEAKARTLATEEIIPIIGEVDSEVWIPLISTLDVIIESVGGMDLCRQTLEGVANAAKELHPEGEPLLSYIHASGTWVHDDSRTEVVTDTTPITNPLELITWRPAMEQLVVQSTEVNGIVILPALLYDRSESILGMLFKTASEGRVVWPGTTGGRYNVIHADDLADLFFRVAEKAYCIWLAAKYSTPQH